MKVIAPTCIARRDDRELVVDWNDGTRSEFSLHFLRMSCPCAQCVNEWTGELMLKPEAVSTEIKPRRLFSVGRYALGIEWSDGHSTGIYSYDYLKKLSAG